MRLITTFFISLYLFSCQEVENKSQKVRNEKLDITYSQSDEQNQFVQRMDLVSLSIDSLWQMVIHKNGCLTGGQNVRNGKIGSEGCVMTTTAEWKALFKKPKSELTSFLLNRLDKRDTTPIHTCPFYSATEGELAVYTLQGIYNKNWFEFEPYKKYTEKVNDENNFKLLGNRNSYQGFLNDSILTNKVEIERMKNLWRKELQ